jgi:hypothetical protein
VRLARDLGTVSALLPEGITHLADLPYRLFYAIHSALTYLGFEEMPKEERPPKRIWQDDKALRAHFAQVERERERKYGNGGGGSQAVDDPVHNDAADSLIVG